MASTSASVLDALNVPGYSIYHAEPHRFSLLDVRISATTTATEAQRSAVDPSSSSPNVFSGPAASSTAIAPSSSSFSSIQQQQQQQQQQQPQPRVCPPAWKDPSQGSRGLGRLRPRSAEIGARAKEALLELGRAAKDKKTTSQVFKAVDAPLEHSQEEPRLAPPPVSSSEMAPTLASVRHVFSLKPPATKASTSNLSITAKKEERRGEEQQRWTKVSRVTPVFVCDEEPRLGSAPSASSSFGAAQRAGTFSADLGPLGHAASDDLSDSDQDEATVDVDAGEAGARVALDPSRLLLQVEPPAALQSSGVDVEHQIKIQARLSIANEALETLANGSPQARRRRLSSSHAPAGPRELRASLTPSNSAAQPSSRVVFVSAPSSRKLLDALNATTCKGQRGGYVGPLASPQAAKLEGIGFATIVEAYDRGGEGHLEWIWSDLSREASANGVQKCACAFVELDEQVKQPKILASFAFVVNMPAVARKSSNVRSPRIKTRSELVATSRGLGLEVDGASEAGIRSDGSRRDQVAIVVTDNPSRTTPGRSSSYNGYPQSPRAGTARAVHVNVNHVEISLEDATEDSPVLRAAVQNLDRRTASLKKAGKAILKTATDVRSHMLALQAAEAALDHHMDDLAGLMPDTVGMLSREVHKEARRRNMRFRQQELDVLDRYVVAPIQVLVEMCRAAQDHSKAFEAESKAYYSATQKWLSSRASTAGSIAPVESGEQMDKASQKQERMDEKQKIRQARFDLARLDVFRSANALHGGEAELELAQQMLLLCRWHANFPGSNWGQKWPTEEAQSMLKGFEIGTRLEEAKVKERVERIREHEESLEARLWSSQDGRGDAELSAAAGSWDLVSPRSADGEPARQPGHRIKTILSSIGRGTSTVAASNTSPGPASTLVASVTNDSIDTAEEASAVDSPTKGGAGQRVRRKISLKMQPLSNPSVAMSSPVFNKIQQRFRPGHQGTMGEASQASPEDPRIAPLLRMENGNKDAKRPRVSSMVPSTSSPPLQQPSEPESGQRPAVSRRSLSFSASGSSSPKLMNGSYFDLLANMISTSPPNAATTATTNRHSSGPMSRSSSDSQHLQPLALSPAMKKAALSPVDLNRPGARPKQASGRKKEGILWAMSKPIMMGGGTADVPRGINRSSHWRECWVVLSGSGHLGEYAEWRDPKVLEPSQPLIDLRFATVREARGVERRFAFEVITRESRRFFQAPDEATMKEWIAAISMAIESLINGTSSVRQIEKVARGSPNPDGEFGAFRGASNGKPVNGDSVDALGQHRAFSQSLTDLSSASSGGPVRLFAKGVEGVRASKRDSRTNTNLTSAHLATLSEGRGSAPSPTKPWLHGSSNHERGISNKTPVSGYVNADSQPDLFACSSAAMSPNVSSSNNSYRHLRNLGSDATEEQSPSSEVGFDYDRKIEAMIQSSYGGSSGGATQGLGLTSASYLSAHKRSSTMTSSESSSSGFQFRTRESRAAEIARLAHLSSNSSCADCGQPDPRWSSWMLHNQPCCIFICITCSGIHRGLGVQISKVKSVDLDDWTEEQIQSARLWGNERANRVYEALKPKGIGPGPTRDKNYWTEKYVKRSWYQEEDETDGGEVLDGDDDDDDDDDDDGYEEHEITLTPTETGQRKDFSRPTSSTTPIGIPSQSDERSPRVHVGALQPPHASPPSWPSPLSASSDQVSPRLAVSPSPSFQERMGVRLPYRQAPNSPPQPLAGTSSPRSPSMPTSASAPFVTMLDAPRHGWASGASSNSSSNGLRSPPHSPITNATSPPVSSSARQPSPRSTKPSTLESSPPSRSKRLSLPSPSFSSTFRKASDSASSTSARPNKPRMSSSSRSSSTSSSTSVSFGLVFPSKDEQARQAASFGIVSVDIPTLSPMEQ